MYDISDFISDFNVILLEGMSDALGLLSEIQFSGISLLTWILTTTFIGAALPILITFVGSRVSSSKREYRSARRAARSKSSKGD